MKGAGTDVQGASETIHTTDATSSNVIKASPRNNGKLYMRTKSQMTDILEEHATPPDLRNKHHNGMIINLSMSKNITIAELEYLISFGCQ